MPFKDILVKLVILLNGFKNNDVMVFNAIKYICAKKKIP